MADFFTEKVYTFTHENALFSAPCHLLIAVSGGADSMALLHMMQNWPKTDVSVSAVHIHHGLRGESADRDAQFVLDYCETNGVPLTVYHENVAAFADASGLSIEEAGRRIRYARFEECRQRCGADYILTAHTASDQAETVLMRIIRGTGLEGLSGIPAKRGTICRPFLCLSREQVEQYCQANQLTFVTDESNFDLQYTRNAIRQQVLPLLKNLNPAVETALNRLASNATIDSTYFDEVCESTAQTSDDTLQLACATLLDTPTAIRRRLIRRLLINAGLTVFEEKHILSIESIVQNQQGSVCLPDGYTATVSAGSLYLMSKTAGPVPECVSVTALPHQGASIDSHFELYLETDPLVVHNLFSKYCLDYDKIQGSLSLRPRLEGDTFRPAERGLSKSIKKLMNEWKIPAHQRNLIPLLCDDVGILLVPGFGCDERVKPTTDTKRFLVWRSLDKQG